MLLNTNSKYIAANTMKSEAFEGVEELLQSLKDKGLRMAILTSGGAKINDILKFHKFDSYFSSVVHHERIQNPKPDTEGFLLAAAECGVKPEESIMVGDTVIDIQTGRNASALATIAITHGYDLPGNLAKSEPDYVVNSLGEIENIIAEFVGVA
jgi:HAD superfamily hydrolase (TIGR01549 family)